MTKTSAQSLIDDYEGNTWLILKLTEDLTHPESLIQPGFAGNCLNWVLGHIVWRRGVAMQVLERDHLWTQDVSALYATGAPPLSPLDETQPLESLREDLDRSNQEIRMALEEATEEFLNQVVPTDRGEKTRFEHLSGFHWHETFHMGQLDMLRALALSKRGE